MADTNDKMFSSYALNSYFVMEPVHLLIILLVLLVGLLLAYRYKLKDRTSTESKDDDKTKKDKTKSKKLFSKSKDKQSINGIRNRKNENLLHEIQDDKMGLLQSKESPTTKPTYEKGDVYIVRKSPEREQKPIDICNGSTNFSDQQQYSTLERKCLSDEIKPNNDKSCKRQSSLKLLHDSIEARNILKSEEVSNCAVKSIEVQHIETNQKLASNDTISCDGTSFKTNITSISPHKHKIEADILDVERTKSYKSDQIENNDSCSIESTKNSKSNLECETKFQQKELKTEKDIELTTDIKDSLNSINKETIGIEDKLLTDTDIKPKVEARVLSVKPKTVINFSSNKPKIGTDSSSTQKTESSSITIKPLMKKTNSINKSKIERTDIFNSKDESNHITTSNNSDPMVCKHSEPLISSTPDHSSNNKSIIDQQNKAINLYAVSSSLSIVNSVVQHSADFTNVVAKADQHSDPCYNEYPADTKQYSIDEKNKIITSDLEYTDNEVRKDDKLGVTKPILPVLDKQEILQLSSDRIAEDIAVPTKISDVDIAVIANSISSEILSNVLEDMKLFSEKILIEQYSDKLADVIIKNNVQHEVLDECDAGPPKTVNIPFSNSSQEITGTNDEEVKKDNSVVMSIGDIGNVSTKVPKNDKSCDVTSLPVIVLNNKIEDVPNGITDDTSLSYSIDEGTKPVVVLRRKRGNRSSKNNLSTKLEDKIRYSGTDRPVSNYAEQLAELLADDDGLDFEFDSDEELPDALEKIKETFQDKPEINTEIGKIQRKYSRAELNEYGVKKLKSKVKSKIDDKKTKLKGDRPLSLYEQDLLSDLINNDDDLEFDDSNEVAEDTIESVQSSVQLLEKKLPFNRDGRSLSNLSRDSNDDYDSLDESTKCHTPESKPVCNGKPRGIGRAAVIDLGSGILKAGMCGEMEPSCYCPSVIGVPRRFSQDVSKMKKGYYVGDEAWTVAGMLAIDYPLKQDVTNWPDVTKIIEHLLDSELKVNDRAHPIMLTEKGLVTSKHREKLTEIIFETFGVPAFYLANQASLALYSMGVTTGICLNAGFDCTQSVPVYEGYSIPHGTVQLDIGGDHVTKHLGRILSSSQGHVFNSSSEKLVLNSMKQSLCYVSQDPINEEDLYKCTANKLQTYTLPDGQEIELSTERFQAPEILFNPQALGLNKPNTAEIIQQSVDRMEESLVPTLQENIVVCGGTSKFFGYGPRLEKELSFISGTKDNYNIKFTENPLLATWIGGSVLSSIGSFRDQWITIDQYADCGSKIVHKMCL